MHAGCNPARGFSTCLFRSSHRGSKEVSEPARHVDLEKFDSTSVAWEWQTMPNSWALFPAPIVIVTCLPRFSSHYHLVKSLGHRFHLCPFPTAGGWCIGGVNDALSEVSILFSLSLRAHCGCLRRYLYWFLSRSLHGG
jgi:hypothetical protein